MNYSTVVKASLLKLAIFYIILSGSSISGTYVSQGTILILRSQFAESPSIVANGELSESVWEDAGILSIKIEGTAFDNSDLVLKFANDDENLFLSFSLSGFVHQDTSLSIFFDTDHDGLLTSPEDGKLINFDNTFLPQTRNDLFWDGSSWQADPTQGNNGLEAGASGTPSSFIIEMMIPLLSSDLVYDGLQIQSTSNRYIALSFTLLNDLNNGTIQEFNFPTTSDNATGYIDMRLAGPEDKDLPVYVPPVQITQTGIPTVTATDQVSEAGQVVDQGVQDEALGVDILIAFIGIFGVTIYLRRYRK